MARANDPEPGYVDLHCHWVHGIDDGARTADEGLAMLRGLGELGFGLVVATPHMRPGLFNGTCDELRAHFTDAAALLPATGVPAVALGAEHFLDDVVHARLLAGEGVPYPGERAVLVELYAQSLSRDLAKTLFDLRLRTRLRPLIAHPERYRRLWSEPAALERLLEAGALALLDVAALAGKYGAEPERCAETLLEAGLYHAACSDLHRPADLVEVGAGMRIIRERYGREELDFLFREGPREILEGRVEE